MLKAFKRKSKAFTLIELLVVIAIIGLLASIVLVSLTGARKRAQDARIIANMGQLRSTAEIFFSNNNTYSGLCNDGDVLRLRDDITNQGGAGYFCEGASTDYCIEVRLNNNQYWCVDSALRSRQYASDPTCAPGVRRCE